MKDENYYNDLLKRFARNQCTPEEVNELMNRVEQNSANRLLLTELKEQFYNLPKENSQITAEQSNRIRTNLLSKIGAETPVVTIRKRSRIWIAAAAMILIITGFYLSGNLLPGAHIKVTRLLPVKENQPDVLPGSDKALLTLADGSTVSLDSSGTRRLIRQGNTKVTVQNGKLVYGSTASSTSEILYNIVSTAHGGQYHIELPDGTQAWLNASSSLRFPTVFSGNERSVEMTGEAYFEVTKNPQKPFVVNINNSKVQVFGTHFNIMAYSEEASVNTTLLEGSVKFINESGSHLLKPGQQSQLTKEGKIDVLNNVDVDEVVAWKNGFFHFETANIETVLRQISRWYDVDIVYQNKKADDLFYVDFPRNTNLAEALKVLTLASGAQFALEGRKVVVKQ